MTLELHMQVVREEGREEGIEEGIEIGMEKGEHTGKLSTARRMKAKNCDIAFIAEMTGLTLEEVEAI